MKEQREIEKKDFMIIGPSNHEVWRVRELWTEQYSYTSGTFYETSYREVEVITTSYEKVFLYTDGEQYFAIRRVTSEESAQAMANSAGWQYGGGHCGKSDTLQELYEVDSDVNKETLNKLSPCVMHHDGNTKALFEKYFERIEEEKKEAERKEAEKKKSEKNERTQINDKAVETAKQAQSLGDYAYRDYLENGDHWSGKWDLGK